jgi:hypothetical protein
MCRLSDRYNSWGAATPRMYHMEDNHTGEQHERMGKLGDLVRFPLDRQ